MVESPHSTALLEIAGDIVGAYLMNNTVDPSDIPQLISKVFYALHDLHRQPAVLRKSGPLVPAVAIEDSVHEDYIICLEDGKKLQMLKRHLSTVYGMSIEEYRERWGLSADYPVVAPGYARRRSAIAKNTGLGMSGRRKRSASGNVQVLKNKNFTGQKVV